MTLPISQDGLTIGPFTANTIDGVFYIKTASPALVTLYYGILPGGEKMAKHPKVHSIDDSSEEDRGVIAVGGIVPGTRLEVVSTEPILQCEFLSNHNSHARS